MLGSRFLVAPSFGFLILAACQAEARNPVLQDSRLQADLVSALDAEHCALAHPYLNPIYKMPWSTNLERSRAQARQVGLGATVDKAEQRRRPSSSTPIEGCPSDPYQAAEFFTTKVRLFDATLDSVIDRLVARPLDVRNGASATLTGAIVEGLWGREFALPNPCKASGEEMAATVEKQAFERLLGTVRERGFDREIDAAFRRWSLEKVNWDRDTATFGIIVPCGARRLSAANRTIDQFLAQAR